MKNNKLCYSYLMGLNDNVLELKNEGFNIELEDENYKIIFPKEKIELFEKFIFNNLNEGYWNEYIGEDIVFIFKFKDKTIKRFVLDKSNQNIILILCCEFTNTKFSSIKEMLLGNDFYKNNIDFNNIN